MRERLERGARLRGEADGIAARLDEIERERRGLERLLVGIERELHPDVMALGALDPSFLEFAPPLTPAQALDCAMEYAETVAHEPARVVAALPAQ